MGTTRVKSEEEKKEEELKKKEKQKKEKPKPQESELRAIVRVGGTDLDGEKPLIRALTGIKGISNVMSKSIVSVSGYDPHIKLGNLTEQDINKIEEIINEPMKYGVPSWMVNRKKDPETGKDIHLTGSDLDVAKKFDIQKMIDLKTQKGVRHMLGLPVRGQRTRSSFRKGRSVGVIRKAIRVVQEKAAEEKKK